MVWWQSLIKRKKNPEKDLKALTVALQAALGDQLQSVIVFGSLARGEFNPEHSDVNVLVVAHLPVDVLPRLGAAFKPWLKKGHPAPILVTPAELPGFARSFPIEFLDMQDHHKVLHGDNPLAHLKVDTQHLRAQCEHDLALAQLRLRQAVASARNDQDVQRAQAQALPSIKTLLAAAGRIDPTAPKLDKINDAKESAQLALGLVETVLKHLRK